ncbi:hypothetical protein Tco_0645903, partial [Tanacetum coccineum]
MSFMNRRKIPESPWGSPIPIGDGDGDVNRFPDGDGDGDEAEKRGWGWFRILIKLLQSYAFSINTYVISYDQMQSDAVLDDVSCILGCTRSSLQFKHVFSGRKIPESLWGSPIPIGDGDGDVNRFPDGDGDGDGDEAEKRGWG